MMVYTAGNGVSYHKDTESYGPLNLLVTVDGIGMNLIRFDSSEDLDDFILGLDGWK